MLTASSRYHEKADCPKFDGVPTPGTGVRLSQLNRRDLLMGLTTASIMLASGCALFRNESELESTFNDLDTYLQRIAGADSQGLIAISEHLRETALRLIGAHDSFVISFNDKATRHSVPEKELEKLVVNYDFQRQQLRNKLLAVQDELHAAVPPQSWPEILEILNRKSQTIATSSLSEA